MTPDRRELAEYVARWAYEEEAKVTACPQIRDPDDVLYDPALAWQAQEELIEMIGFQEAANKVQATMNVLGCTRIEATHRALRAARGGE